MDYSKRAFIQLLAAFLVCAAIFNAGCGKSKPVWPLTLAEQTLDAAGMKEGGRREFRRLVELCNGGSCGVIELTWWSVGEKPGKICGVRVVQLGGEALVFLKFEPNAALSEAKLFVKIPNRGMFGKRDAIVERRLSGDGELFEL